MYSQEDFQAVVDQLKTKIATGKVVCFNCHFPISGSNIKQIDMINARITYNCPNGLCKNKDKAGFRSFKALEIVVPSIAPPTDLTIIDAPVQPTPEEVDWDTEDGVIDSSETDEDDEDDETHDITETDGFELPSPSE